MTELTSDKPTTVTAEQRQRWRTEHVKRGTFGVAASERILVLLDALDAAEDVIATQAALLNKLMDEIEGIVR